MSLKLKNLPAILCTLFFLVSLPLHLNAQQADSTSRGFLPLGGFDSDGGFGAGLMFQQVVYDGVTEPYKRLIRIRGDASLVGNISFKSDYERRQPSGKNIAVTFLGQRIARAFFFGTGSGTAFERPLWDAGFYDYERWYGFLSIERGIPLATEGSLVRSEFIYGIQSEFLHTTESDFNALYELRPDGFRGGWQNQFTAALHVDYRNSVFRPSDGYRLNVKVGAVPGLLINDFSSLNFKADVSHYLSFNVITDIVLATRFQMKQTVGKAPFFALQNLGGPDDLRGFPFERFHDYGATFHNIELRTWLIKLPLWNMEWGG